LTSRVESEILKAFDAIHSLNVVHDDVRAENILVAEDGNTAWIIDFEFAEIVKEEDTRKTLISEETQAVRDLLEGLKNHRSENGFHEELK
jgi:serine/threonine protein kinase